MFRLGRAVVSAHGQQQEQRTRIGWRGAEAARVESSDGIAVRIDAIAGVEFADHVRVNPRRGETLDT